MDVLITGYFYMNRSFIVVLIFIIISINLFSADNNIEVKFNEAVVLFDKGEYQEAIKIYEKIKKDYPDSSYSLKADLEILKNSYYDWDLKKAVRIGTEIINAEKLNNNDFFKIKFYAYWWLISTYEALKDKKNELLMQIELIKYYEANKSLINDNMCDNIYLKVLKRVEK